MRRVIHSAAMSLDGYIARTDGGYDWIPDEPAIDWAAFMERFDTVVMGRRTWQTLSAGGGPGWSDKRTVVFSGELDALDHPGVEVSRDDPVAAVGELRSGEGGDVWLMGGGRLFRTLLDAGAVDRVEIAVVPILLGDGIPFLPAGERGFRLELIDTQIYPSGIVLLTYDVMPEDASGASDR